MIKLVYSILGQAATEGASDIHFEAGEDDMRVRFRVDGVLHEAARVPKRMISGVVSRVKIMSELDIAEKRVPQDGRVSVNVEDRKVDLRVVTLPTQRGEGATIRILDKEQALRTLDELGMDGDGRERFEASFTKSHGAVLVTGPTGSGKSTTLYAALAELNAVEKNIITIEDPVEYRIDGVNQIGVNRKAGLDLRHRAALDPARRPRHHHGRRDPRRRDGADRDRVGADRPHGALDPAHQRRPGHDHAAGEDGDRELPHRLGGRLRRRPAPGAPALHPLQAAHGDPADGAQGGRLPGRRRPRGLRAGRLSALQPQRLPRAGSASSR